MWALVLTIMTIRGVSVESVPGFATYSLCNEAGQTYIERGRKTIDHAHYVCVKVSNQMENIR